MSAIANVVHRRMKIVSALAFGGILVSAYLVYKHYTDPTGTGFCNISDKLSCDVVNKSIYSEIFGIPVALIGVLGYVFIFLVSLGIAFEWNFSKLMHILRPGLVIRLLYWTTGGALLFSLYLTYMEIFELQAFCPFCLIQQAIIFTIFIILMSVRYSIEEDVEKTKACEFC